MTLPIEDGDFPYEGYLLVSYLLKGSEAGVLLSFGGLSTDSVWIHIGYGMLSTLFHNLLL